VSDKFKQPPATPVAGIEGIGKTGLIEAGKFPVNTFGCRTSFGAGDEEEERMAFVIRLGAREIEIEGMEETLIVQTVEQGKGIIPADKDPNKRAGRKRFLEVAKKSPAFLAGFGGREGPRRREGMG